MIKIIKTWFYYQFKERKYLKSTISFYEYLICKEISEVLELSDDTKEEVLDFYGLQYNKGE